MRTIVDQWVQIVDVTSVTKGEYCAGIRYGRERPKRARYLTQPKLCFVRLVGNVTLLI
jgi:hypothetical protein